MCNLSGKRPLEKLFVLLFTRYPVAGEAKTRLIPHLGAEGAAQLQKSMTEYTLRQIQEAFCHASVSVCYTGAPEAAMRTWLGQHVEYWEQGEGDLGQRLERAVKLAFAQGAEKVLLLGADCPDNRVENLQEAVQLLETSPCVLGPAHDGGYYLLGLRQEFPQIFAHIDWGTDAVLAQTLSRLTHYALLPVLHDVDYVQDVPPRISVIIPSYNEEDCIARTIHSALKGFRVEVLVADGGSNDATCLLAHSLGAKVIHCDKGERGRAQQMNVGAAQSQGDIVLFLHADSVLPQGWDRRVRRLLQDDSVALGYFSFAVSGTFVGKAVLTWGTNMRARYLRKPYGDQGLFLRKKDFLALGGYAPEPLLEDVFLVKKAARYGKVVSTELALLTSGRRWIKHGFLKVIFLNQMVLLAAALGVGRHRLAKMYRAGSLFSLFQKK